MGKQNRKRKVVPLTTPEASSEKKPLMLYIFVYAMVGFLVISLLSLSLSTPQP